MNTEDMIEVTGCDLVKLVKDVYHLSRPQGMGYLHYTEGALSDEDAQTIIDQGGQGDCIVSMDYIYGRACKFNVWKDEDDRLWIRSKWFDHTDGDQQSLLALIKPIGE